nr:hypothetical protein [uncultured Cohaesibacter sp.]
MSVSISNICKLAAVGALGLGLSGCITGPGGMKMPTFGSSNTASPAAASSAPDAPGVTSSARDVASGGPIMDSTTNLILNNAKQINGYCPSVSILGDTNVYQTYAKGGDGNANMLIHQANITQTARECTDMGAEMYIKVGVAGRVLGGPKSADKEKAVLPLRIVIKQKDNVLYSKLHQVPVMLAPPDRSGLFAKVDEGIAIPAPQTRDVQILVGFDSGKN